MKLRFFTVILATPMAMILLLLFAHFGPAPAEAQRHGHGGPPSNLGLQRRWNPAPPSNSFSDRIAGSYVMKFEFEFPREIEGEIVVIMGEFKTLITLHADGTYIVSNQMGQTELGNWEKTGRRKIKGAGLTFIVEEGKFRRNKAWTLTFDDSSLTNFDISITDADQIPVTEDTLDASIESEALPLPLPLSGRGDRIPTVIVNH